MEPVWCARQTATIARCATVVNRDAQGRMNSTAGALSSEQSRKDAAAPIVLQLFRR